MKNWKVRNCMNWERNLATDVEHSSGPSMTVPGEALSVEEIVRRYRGGVLPDHISARQEIEGFDGEPSHDDMDLELIARQEIDERYELSQGLAQQVASLEDALKPKPEPVQPPVAVAPVGPNAEERP